MMKTSLIPILFLALPLCAQESVTEVRRQVFGNPLDQGNETLINLLNVMERESVFDQMLYPAWQPLRSMGLDSTVLAVDSANYHIGQDRIYFIYLGKLFQLHPEKIDYAALAGRKFVLLQDPLGQQRGAQHFFEVLEEGEYTLLRRYTVKTEVVNDHPMGISAARRTEHRHLETFFYLREGSAQPQPIPSKKRDFIMSFRKHRPEMAIFAREHRISLRSAEDLSRIFAYYNHLTGDK